MMDLKYLMAKREDIIRQRDNAYAVNQQAVGALALIDHLIQTAKESKDSLTLDELAEALGAESAELVSAEDNGG